MDVWVCRESIHHLLYASSAPEFCHNYRHQILSVPNRSLTCVTLCSWLRHAANSAVNVQPVRVPSRVPLGEGHILGLVKKQQKRSPLLSCHHSINQIWCICSLPSSIWCNSALSLQQFYIVDAKEEWNQNNNCPGFLFHIHVRRCILSWWCHFLLSCSQLPSAAHEIYQLQCHTPDTVSYLRKLRASLSVSLTICGLCPKAKRNATRLLSGLCLPCRGRESLQE